MSSTLELGAMRVDALDGGSLAFSFERPARSGAARAKLKLELAVRPLLVRTRDWSCLIDPGFGPADPTRRERFRLRDPVPLERQCDALGLRDGPDHVLLTHLHFDHAAGALADDVESKEPRFPRASHHVHPTEWRAAVADRRGGDLAARLEAVLGRTPEALPDRGEVWPGLSVELAPGHTDGLVAVWLVGRDARALFAADLLPTTRFLTPRLDRMADQDPELALTTRTGLLDRCAASDAYVCFYHDVLHPWGRLAAAEGTDGWVLRD